MNESARTRALCAIMTKQGALCKPLIGDEFGEGWPDRLVVARGAIFFFEAKMEDAPLRPLQKEIIRQLKERGAHAFIVRYRGKNIEVDDKITTTAPEFLSCIRRLIQGA